MSNDSMGVFACFHSSLNSIPERTCALFFASEFAQVRTCVSKVPAMEQVELIVQVRRLRSHRPTPSIRVH